MISENKILCLFIVSLTLSFIGCTATEYRRLPVKEYRDKLEAGWIGQIVGVSWGAPTEFRWVDAIIPEEDMPKWTPDKINDAFNQDDLYVEMTFLRTLEEYGIDVSIRQAGIDFANSEYQLWAANDAARKNLRAGIAPPDCSHPEFSTRTNDIDYQIEADFSGLIAPGMPNVSIALGEKFGRLMNYSDGVYGGQFVGAMYAEAFFEDDIFKIIDAGLASIPSGSLYAGMVRDVVQWYKENPENWEATWKLCQQKYREDPEYQKCSNGGIDVIINGAYILVGMLYGEKDPSQTIIISMRCGQDSDCNPSNAAGILFTAMGMDKLPSYFKEGLDRETVFSHTKYNFTKLLDVCEKLASDYVISEGGRIEIDKNGETVFVIPYKKAIPSKLVFCWEPEPVENSLYTEKERGLIKFKGFLEIEESVADLFPRWKISNCGKDMDPGYRELYKNKKDVIMTHPLNKEQPCVLSTQIDIPENMKTTLKVSVSHHNKGDWNLIIRVNGSPQKEVLVSAATVDESGWVDVELDLTPFAGSRNLLVDLENKANGWMFEAAYWSEINIIHESV